MKFKGKFEPVGMSTSANLSPHTNRIQSLDPISSETLNRQNVKEETFMITEENTVQGMNFAPRVNTKRDVGGN